MTDDDESMSTADIPSAADDEYVPVGTHGLLRASEKLLQMSRGLAEDDARDSYQFKRIMTPAALLRERVAMDTGGVVRGLLRHAAHHRSLKGMHPGALSPLAEKYVVGNGQLVSPIEEINPLDIMGQSRRITAMGPGGVGSKDAITQGMQAIHASQFGFVSGIEGPECFDFSSEVYTARGWVAWPLVTMEDLLACQIAGALVWHKPQRLIKERYKGPMILGENESIRMCVTPGHRVFYKSQYMSKKWKVDSASEVYGRTVRIPIRHQPEKGDENQTVYSLFGVKVDLLDWAECLGWWLAEGSHSGNKADTDRAVRIHQCPVANPSKHARIKALLLRLQFITPKGKHTGDSFTISAPHVRKYFAQWTDGCYNKWIPEFCFDWPVAARERMLEALLLGDGRYNKKRMCYCSVSSRLAHSVERLAVGLGYPAFIREEKDSRESVKTTNYVVSISRAQTRMLKARVNGHKNGKSYGDYWHTIPYDDFVYCASVPGGMLLARGKPGTAGFWTGNSESAGIDVRMAHGVKVGSNGRLYQRFRNPRTGHTHWLSPEDLAGKTVALPNPV